MSWSQGTLRNFSPLGTRSWFSSDASEKVFDREMQITACILYSTFLTASPGSVLFSRSTLLKRKDLCFSCLRHETPQVPGLFYSTTKLQTSIAWWKSPQHFASKNVLRWIEHGVKVDFKKGLPFAFEVREAGSVLLGSLSWEPEANTLWARVRQ